MRGSPSKPNQNESQAPNQQQQPPIDPYIETIYENCKIERDPREIRVTMTPSTNGS
jgi:hypothetical protein